MKFCKECGCGLITDEEENSGICEVCIIDAGLLVSNESWRDDDEDEDDWDDEDDYYDGEDEEFYADSDFEDGIY